MIKHTIERVELEGIHNRYDLDIFFTPTLNILFGENGTGKSTLIHIIANVLNCDFIRFAFLEFHKIRIT
uniref:AAA family ATPase n=1 Tax=Psychrobacter sp. ASPA161_9 TaxID=3160961 RepID=UPI003F7D8E6B